jgi:hypothetical protein
MSEDEDLRYKIERKDKIIEQLLDLGPRQRGYMICDTCMGLF